MGLVTLVQDRFLREARRCLQRQRRVADDAAETDPTAFAIVEMAAFFAVVRAPLTGIVLIAQMTGSFTMPLPTPGSCFAAMVVPTLSRDAPIYDFLEERRLK